MAIINSYVKLPEGRAIFNASFVSADLSDFRRWKIVGLCSIDVLEFLLGVPSGYLGMGQYL